MRRLAFLAVLALLSLLASGCLAPDLASETGTTTTGPVSTSGPPRVPGCTDPHWHATFGLFIPGPDGQPMQVDFATPRTPLGRPYYDYASSRSGGADKMTVALHMHQEGAEAGSAALGPTQWHMEGLGICTPIEEALRIVDVEASATTLNLYGGHEQVAGQAGIFTANGTSVLRWWIQLREPDGPWTWQSKSWDELAARTMQDGESLLGVLGDYTDSQVAAMQASVPAPISRTA